MSDHPHLFSVGFVDSLTTVKHEVMLVFLFLFYVALLKHVTMFAQAHYSGSILLFIKLNELEPWLDAHFIARWSMGALGVVEPPFINLLMEPLFGF